MFVCGWRFLRGSGERVNGGGSCYRAGTAQNPAILNSRVSATADRERERERVLAKVRLRERPGRTAGQLARGLKLGARGAFKYKSKQRAPQQSASYPGE